ncbi:MAG: diguanylate cyclase [Marinobacter sp.]|uniref:sensor domain-containing diguanylate cyclase n=1 Tax=Marinobacter sp. TaxID=50741 RepID=UPI00299D26C5|nr:diguanylate cyclase [Marinobacter sp.]MDX1756259.1 diguanylate cyclase [Marinobacter sp.]
MLRRWLDSLVNRAVILVIVAISLTAVALTVVNSLVSRQELQAQAETRVASLANLIATELDRKLVERLEALTDVARSLTMTVEAFEGRAQLLVERQVALRHLFDAVYLFDTQGIVIGEYPRDYDQIGRDVSDRDYFRQASGQLTLALSEPYRSHGNQLPAFMMAMPVFDHRGRLIGVLGGAIRLDGDNFMADLADVRLGQSGYLYAATRAGTTLAHGRAPTLVLQPAPSRSEVFEDALAGFEGTRLAVNRQGLETLVSIRQLNQAPWFVAAIWPLQEAFAPAERLAQILLWVALAVLVVLVPLALLVYRRLLAPLTDLAEQITERHLGLRSRAVKVGGGREIRQVADTFNTVLDERSEVVASLADREAFFRSLSQSAPIGILQADVLGRIEFVNPTFEKIVGAHADELRHRYLATFIHPEDRDEAVSRWLEARNVGGIYRGQLRIRHRSEDRTIWVDVMTARIDAADKALGTITVARDITHELEVEAELRAEQRRAESILGVLQEGVLLTDRDGNIRYSNQAARDFLGFGGAGVGGNFFELVTVEADGESWDAARFQAEGEVPVLDGELYNRDGDEFDIELTMLRLNPGEEKERLVFVLRDDSERRRQEERLSWEATHDSLTGLLNRRAFTASLNKYLGEAANLSTPSVLMLIDLDQFKPVNDQGGHLLGDELLRELASVLSESVRKSDSVARLGGDEFGILLPACGLSRAETLAEDIRQAVASVRVDHNGQQFGVTASIGLTELSARDSGPRETVARADEGCYAAKARGRNTVVSVPLPPETP